MSEAAFEAQAAFVTREMGEAFFLERESLEDLGRNAARLAFVLPHL